jgi:hypothetical protein
MRRVFAILLPARRGVFMICPVQEEPEQDGIRFSQCGKSMPIV